MPRNIEEIDEKKLATFDSSKLANILVEIYGANPDVQKEILVKVALLCGDRKKIVSVIKKDISDLKRGTKFISYHESSSFALRLDKIRSKIVNELLKESPNDALELMLSLLDSHKKVLNRIDDSNGSVGGVYKDSSADLGKILSAIDKSTDEDKLCEIIYNRFTKDDYGIYDRLIIDCKEALSLKVLSLIRDRLKSSTPSKYSNYIKSGLKQIADCRNNVDEYIEACIFDSSPTISDIMEITSRLNRHWRFEEVLKWLDKIDLEAYRLYGSKISQLKVEALEGLGKYREAQEEQIRQFQNDLSPSLYFQIIKNAKSDFKERFKQMAIDCAMQFIDSGRALSFFVEIQEFETCADYILDNIDKINGSAYNTIRPVADILRDMSPLASTLLYRKLMGPILLAARSKYYKYAAKDLVSCQVLSTKITDWQGNQDHSQFLLDIREANKRKVSFWKEYNIALQKYIQKKQKQKQKETEKDKKT